MFIEEHLQDLRRERFAPSALIRYARQALAAAREAIEANPGAVRSVWTVALIFFGAAFVAAVALALSHERRLAQDFLAQTLAWVLATFTLLTLNIGLLRDRDGYRLSALNLPTILTVLRVALMPGIVLFSTRHLVWLALSLFVAAALSDVADGWLARRWRQETRLGTVLDPVVDILFGLAVFFALTAAGWLPGWVFGLAALRYGILLLGGAFLYLFVGPVRIHPTVFGRLSGVLTSTLVAFLVLLHGVHGALRETLEPLTEVALGVLMATTVVHVVALGWYNLRMMTGAVSRVSGRVVGDVRWGPQ